MGVNENSPKWLKTNDLVTRFVDEHLAEKYLEYAVNIISFVLNKGKLGFDDESAEAWAARTIFLLGDFNGLFDRYHKDHVPLKTVGNYFQKPVADMRDEAGEIAVSFGLDWDDPRFMLPSNRVELPPFENLNPPPAIGRKQPIAFKFVDGKEAEEIEKWAREREQRREAHERKRKERRAEINREIARKRRERKKAEDPQLSLFDDFTAEDEK